MNEEKKLLKGIIPAPDLPDEDTFGELPRSLLIINKGDGGEFRKTIEMTSRAVLEEIASIFPKDTPAEHIAGWVGSNEMIEESTILYSEDETMLFATLPAKVMSEIELLEDPDMMNDLLVRREERLRREEDVRQRKEDRKRAREEKSESDPS